MGAVSEQPFAVKKAHCSSCAATTKHLVIAEREQTGSDEYDEHYAVSWRTTYEMLECCGCETVHLSSATSCSEWGPGDEEIRRFPPAVSRRPPTWLYKLESDRCSLFKEVYAALDADSRRLAVMGARTVLDIFLVENVGDIGGFEVKLNALEKKGAIGRRDREILEAALDACHAASHRGHNPTAEDVNHVMDIVENLFTRSLLGPAAEALRKRTPPR